MPVSLCDYLDQVWQSINVKLSDFRENQFVGNRLKMIDTY